MAKSKGQFQANGSLVDAAIAASMQLEDMKEKGRWFRGAGSFKPFRFEVYVDDTFDSAVLGALRKWGQDRGMTEAQIVEANRVLSWAPQAQHDATRSAVERLCLGRVAVADPEGDMQSAPAPNEIVQGERLEWLLSRAEFIDQVVRARRRLINSDDEVVIETGKASELGSHGTENELKGSETSGDGTAT